MHNIISSSYDTLLGIYEYNVCLNHINPTLNIEENSRFIFHCFSKKHIKRDSLNYSFFNEALFSLTIEVFREIPPTSLDSELKNHIVFNGHYFFIRKISTTEAI